MAQHGWSYQKLAGLRGEVMDCVRGYVSVERLAQKEGEHPDPDGIRNKRHLGQDGGNLSAKRIHFAEEVQAPPKLGTFMQLVETARLESVQTFEVVGQAFEEIYPIYDISMMMQPAQRFEATEGLPPYPRIQPSYPHPAPEPWYPQKIVECRLEICVTEQPGEATRLMF
jgi:hypothetical protein